MWRKKNKTKTTVMTDVLAGKIAVRLRIMQDSIVVILKRCESRMTMRQKKAVFILFVIAVTIYCNYVLVSALTGTTKREWLRQLHDTTVHQPNESHIITKK